MIHDKIWLDRYRTDGFFVGRQFLSPDEVTELVEHVRRYIQERVPAMPSEQVFYEDQQQPESLKQIQQMWKHDDYFHALMTEGRFRQVAEKCLAGPVVPKNLQYFNKSPGVNQPTPVHQDAFYFMLDPPMAVTMWLALDEVDEENGCVRYIPGSHRQPLRSHQRTGTLGFSQGITDYPLAGETEREVPLCARPGDLLVHDAMTIHRADGNRSSTRNRRALGMIYYSKHAKEDTAGHAKYQRQLASEMKLKGRV
ncbi:MAG: phytanoyl-CoA dioxygenase family protein [Planctomycetota bacterium]|nr:phytanoyl-CoA dioxygenase family protein [Planctomycetota bacterium]